MPHWKHKLYPGRNFRSLAFGGNSFTMEDVNLFCLLWVSHYFSLCLLTMSIYLALATASCPHFCVHCKVNIHIEQSPNHSLTGQLSRQVTMKYAEYFICQYLHRDSHWFDSQ